MRGCPSAFLLTPTHASHQPVCACACVRDHLCKCLFSRYILRAVVVMYMLCVHVSACWSQCQSVLLSGCLCVCAGGGVRGEGTVNKTLAGLGLVFLFVLYVSSYFMKLKVQGSLAVLNLKVGSIK